MGSGGEQPASYLGSPPRPGGKDSPAKPGRGRFQSLLERDKKVGAAARQRRRGCALFHRGAED